MNKSDTIFNLYRTVKKQAGFACLWILFFYFSTYCLLFNFRCNNLSAQTQLIAFSDGKKWGFLSSDGKIAIKAKYDNAYIQKNGFVWLQKGKKFGLIDPVGKIIHPVKFDFFYKTALNGSNYSKIFLYVAKKNKKYAVLGKKGEILQPFELDSVFNFYDTSPKERGDDYSILARFLKKGKYGFFDTEGKIVIPPDYDLMGNIFIENLLPVKKDGKWGVIDRNNFPFTPFIYDSAAIYDKEYIFVQKDKKWGVVTKNNKQIHPFIFDSLSSIYTSGYSGTSNILSDLIISGYQNDTPVTYISGKKITGYEINSEDPSSSLSKVKNRTYVALTDNQRLNGIFSEDLQKIIINPEYERITDFGFGGFYLASKKNMVGLLDSTGKVILPIEYQRISIFYPNNNNPMDIPFYDEKSNISSQDSLLHPEEYTAEGNTGYILFSKLNPDVLDEINGSYALPERIITTKYLHGLLDLTGKVILPCEYEDIYGAYASKRRKAHTETMGLYRFLPLKEKIKEIIPQEYSFITIFDRNTFLILKGKKILLVDSLGKSKIPGSYDAVLPTKDGNYIVVKNRSIGLVNEQGKTVIPVEYDRLYDKAGKPLIQEMNSAYSIYALTNIAKRPPVKSTGKELYQVSKDGKNGIIRGGDLKEIVPMEESWISYQDGFYIRQNEGFITHFYTQAGKKITFENKKYTDIRVLNGSESNLYSGTCKIFSKNYDHNTYKRLTGYEYNPHLLERTILEFPDVKGFALKEYDKWAIFDTNFNQLSGWNYDMIGRTFNNLTEVGKSEHWGVEGCDDFAIGFVDISGKEVLPCKFLKRYHSPEESVFWDRETQHQFLIIETKEGMGLIDDFGKIILPCRYKDITRFQETDYLFVETDDKRGLFSISTQTWFIDTTLNKETISPANSWSDFLSNYWLLNTKDFNRQFELLKKSVPIYPLWLKMNDKFALFDGISQQKKSEFIYDNVTYDFIGKNKQAYAVVKKDGKFGSINYEQSPIIPFEFDTLIHWESCQFDDSDTFRLFIAQKNKKWGLIDRSGRNRINYEFDTLIGSFAFPHLLIAKKNHKYGVLRIETGKLLIPYKYDSIIFLNLNCILAETGTDESISKWMLLDLNGKEIYESSDYLNFRSATLFNRVYIKENNQWFLMDITSGRKITEGFTDVVINQFNWGYGYKHYKDYISSKAYSKQFNVCIVKYLNKWGIIDSSGNEILEPKFDKITPPKGTTEDFIGYEDYDDTELEYEGGPDSEVRSGRRIFTLTMSSPGKIFTIGGREINLQSKSFVDYYGKSFKNIIIYENDKTYIIDSAERVIFPPKYQFLDRTSDNLILFTISGPRNEYFLTGISDSAGNEILPAKYRSIVRVKRSRISSDFEYDPEDAPQTSSGEKLKEYLSPPKIFQITDEKHKIGWAGFDGKIIIPCKYDDISNTSRRDCWIIEIGKGNNTKYGWIDESGKEVKSCQYDYLEFDIHSLEFVKIKLGKKYGILKYDGTEILPCIYDEIGDLKNDIISVKLNNRWGFFDFKGVSITGLDFQTAEDYGCTCCPDTRFTRITTSPVETEKIDPNITKQISKVGLVMNGKVIVSPEYKEISEVYANGLIEIKKFESEKWGLMQKSTGKIVTDFVYDQIKILEGSLEDVFVKVRIGDKYGLVSSEGEAIPVQYDEIISVNANTLAIQEGKNWFLTNLRGIKLNSNPFNNILGEYERIRRINISD